MTIGLDGLGDFAGYGRSPFRNLARFGGGTQLQLVDFTYWETNGIADATGTVTLQSDPVPGDEYWLVERLFADSTSLQIGRLDVYEGTDANAQYRRDWAPVPFAGPLVRAYQPSLIIRSNRAVLAVIKNLQQGDRIRLSVSYAVVTRTSVKGTT